MLLHYLLGVGVNEAKVLNYFVSTLFAHEDAEEYDGMCACVYLAVDAVLVEFVCQQPSQVCLQLLRNRQSRRLERHNAIVLWLLNFNFHLFFIILTYLSILELLCY